MANTQLFKNTARNMHRKRYLTDEGQFSKGMQFTNAPLAEEYAKAIVNFDLKNDGASLVPRGGLHNITDSPLCSIGLSVDTDYFVHHADATYVLDSSGNDAALCNYFILCKRSISSKAPDITTAKLVIEYDNTYFAADYDTTVQAALTGKLLMKPPITDMQDLHISEPFARDGIYASLEGNTYVLVDTNNSHELGRLIIKFNNDRSDITWYIERVVPKEVQPAQAINYGYNMLKEQPYTFVNTVSATGAVQLTGVVPYDESNNLLLTARPGTPMVFELFYKYPQTDVDNEDKYLVQWEIQDLNNTSDAEVIKKVRGSEEYTPGDHIRFAYTPSYTAFSIIVRLYKKSEITAQDTAWDNDPTLQKLVTKDDNLTPNQVTTLASYYLTSNSDTSMLNVAPVSYDLATATGMCSWQQRLILWGVEGAKSTLFVSEINDPGYMPYPNNCEIFKNDIICAIPYMTSLLVFTKTSLYKLTLNDDGLTYTSECVQERLNMTAQDINTVITVQNMVYFKSGNYFYMVVPNNSLTSASNVQLAPVSRMVEQMFDNIYTMFVRLLNEVYDLSYDGYHPEISFELIDFNVQLANNQIRNIYKVAVQRLEGAGTNVTYYFDICLNYDTVLRAWTTYIYQTNKFRDCIYTSTVTGENILIHLFIDSVNVKADLIQADSLRPYDDIALDNYEVRQFGNWQYINTGYRDFNEDLKKRFREVQFCINMLETHTFKFNTAFVVDDVDKIPLYKHIVSQCTDPLDPNYGTIFVERELMNEISTPSSTIFNEWELDTAAFPDLTVYKVRYKVSGKGYGGAVKILSKNEFPFELLHINWVYRLMFAR